MRRDFRDGSLEAGPGQMIVVPRGVEHKPFAENETSVMIIEPRGVINTGDGDKSDRTANNDVWI